MSSRPVNVKGMMNKSIISVDSNDSIKLAVRKMVRGNIGSVVITEKSKPVGMLTERDILRSIADEKLNPEEKVETIMSTPLISVESNATLGEAADIMLVNNIRRLLVKENDDYVGIISQRELQRYITGSE